jgi:hypothetical protein
LKSLFELDPMLDWAHVTVLPSRSPGCGAVSEVVSVWVEAQVKHSANGGYSRDMWMLTIGALRLANQIGALQKVFAAAGIHDWHSVEAVAAANDIPGMLRWAVPDGSHFSMDPQTIEAYMKLEFALAVQGSRTKVTHNCLICYFCSFHTIVRRS